MKKLIVFTIGLFAIIGCEKIPVGNEFLEKPPGVDVTADTVFSNLEYAERFLWNIYRTLPYGLNVDDGNFGNKLRRDVLESLTDINYSYLMDGGAQRLYYSGALNSSMTDWMSNVGQKFHFTNEQQWIAIRRAHIFIEGIERVPNVDPAYKRRLQAEAMLIKAIHYHEVFRHLGGMPWLTSAFRVGDETMEFPRITAQAMADSIVALCDRAAKDLPLSVPESEDGRLTSIAAMAIKARVLLFNASPLFNDNAPYLDGEASQMFLTWHGQYDHNLWKRAADAANDVISLAESTGEYGLYENPQNSPRQNFQNAYYLRGNGEVLISVRDRFRAPTGWSTGYYFHASVTWGCGLVTHEAVQMFPMDNGLPIDDPASGYDPENPYINRDPRLYETALVNGDTYRGRTAEVWIGGRERTTETGTAARTGYRLRKFVLDGDNATNWGAIVHWPLLRLPEIYLSYAEAINEFNNGPTPEAYRSVNIVRNRVGLPDLPSGLTQEEFREAVILERVLELAYEEVRWFDIVRWKRDDIFTKPLHGMDIYKVETDPDVFEYNVWELPKRYWATNWDRKWFLTHIPDVEINKNYGLVQNPGW